MADADPALLSEPERAFLRALNDLGVRYLLVGMSAALLQGARGSTDDLDLWFEDIADPRIGDAARAAGGFWITRMQPPRLGGPLGDRLDVVTSLTGIPDFAAEYAGATEEDLEGITIRLLPLARILHSKRAAGRSKDEPGIHQIEIALEVLKRSDE